MRNAGCTASSVESRIELSMTNHPIYPFASEYSYRKHEPVNLFVSVILFAQISDFDLFAIESYFIPFEPFTNIFRLFRVVPVLLLEKLKQFQLFKE